MVPETQTKENQVDSDGQMVPTCHENERSQDCKDQVLEETRETVHEMGIWSHQEKVNKQSSTGMVAAATVEQNQVHELPSLVLLQENAKFNSLFPLFFSPLLYWGGGIPQDHELLWLWRTCWVSATLGHHPLHLPSKVPCATAENWFCASVGQGLSDEVMVAGD